MMPPSIDPVTDAHNISTLEKRLNEPDAFDKELLPKDRDRLAIKFTIEQDYASPLSYCFAFKKRKGVKVDYENFDLMSRFTEVKSGKIKTALRRK